MDLEAYPGAIGSWSRPKLVDLVSVFGTSKGEKLESVMSGAAATEHFPRSRRAAAEMFNRPSLWDVSMMMCAEVIHEENSDLFGVQHLKQPYHPERFHVRPGYDEWIGFDYVGSGDVYDETVFLDLSELGFFIATFGVVSARLEEFRRADGVPSFDALMAVLDDDVWEGLDEDVRGTAGSWADAWYWFLAENHGGQGSAEYYALSLITEHYSPSPLAKGTGYPHLLDEIVGI